MRPLVARGLATADYDRDGDPDFVVTQCGGRAILYRNDNRTGGGWLGVRLWQPGKNPDAIGARVTVVAGERSRTVTVRTGGSYCSQNSLTIPFGLGAGTTATVTVDFMVFSSHSGTSTFRRLTCRRAAAPARTDELRAGAAAGHQRFTTHQ